MKIEKRKAVSSLEGREYTPTYFLPPGGGGLRRGGR